eukprot:252489-Pleurochrysis_carterae.AAC.1
MRRASQARARALRGDRERRQRTAAGSGGREAAAGRRRQGGGGRGGGVRAHARRDVRSRAVCTAGSAAYAAGSAVCTAGLSACTGAWDLDFLGYLCFLSIEQSGVIGASQESGGQGSSKAQCTGELELFVRPRRRTCYYFSPAPGPISNIPVRGGGAIQYSRHKSKNRINTNAKAKGVFEKARNKVEALACVGSLFKAKKNESKAEALACVAVVSG